jgi:mRNA-degrading endonuclease RelE of RelBE toxin-antitoxin system
LAFRITITEEAQSHWRALGARDQRILEAAFQSRLVNQPTVETRAVKKLRPNPLAQFELRIGDLRVLYNVEGSEVVLLVVGRKVGNKLIVKNQEFYAHQDDSIKPAGDKPAGDPE